MALSERLERIYDDAEKFPLMQRAVLRLGIVDPDLLMGGCEVLHRAPWLLEPINIGLEIQRAVKGIRDKVSRFFRKLLKKEPGLVGHPPARLLSPEPNNFQAEIDTGEKAKYDTAIHYVVTCANLNHDEDEDGKRTVGRYLKKLTLAERGSTLTLDALTPDKIDGCEFRVRPVDDLYEDIPYEEILEQAAVSDRKVVFSLAGVHTSHYPRALHIAGKIKAEAIRRNLGDKIDILVGGFHVRGNKESRQELMDNGFIPCIGEAELLFPEILQHSVHSYGDDNRMQSSYECGELVELKGKPMMKPVIENMRDFNNYQAVPKQLSRGCPHNCSFCAVSAIDGKRVRPRTPDEMKVMFEYYAEQGFKKTFIMDDNFHEHPYKDEILDLLIEMNERGDGFETIIQCDLGVLNPDGSVDKEFIKKCKRAGVVMIFCGAESFSAKVLKELSKGVNLRSAKMHSGEKVKDGDPTQIIEAMKAQVDAWHEEGIGVQFSVMLGNEGDTPDVGRRTAKILDYIGVDVAIPMIRMVLPGSRDDTELRTGRTTDIDPDFSKYTGSHGTITWTRKGALTPEQVEQERRNLIKYFYTPERINERAHTAAALKHGYWFGGVAYVILQDNIMDVGLGKQKLWAEVYDPKEHKENLRICKDHHEARLERDA